MVGLVYNIGCCSLLLQLTLLTIILVHTEADDDQADSLCNDNAFVQLKGAIVPDIPNVVVGQPINLNCSLCPGQVDPSLNSSQMYFMYQNTSVDTPSIILPSEYYEIIDPQTLSLLYLNASRSDSGVYMCYINQSSVGIYDETQWYLTQVTVVVGMPAEPITWITAVSNNYENLTMTWCPANAAADMTTYTVCWTKFFPGFSISYTCNPPASYKYNDCQTIVLYGNVPSSDLYKFNYSFNYSILINGSNVFGPPDSTEIIVIPDLIVQPLAVLNLQNSSVITSTAFEITWDYSYGNSPKLYDLLFNVRYQPTSFSDHSVTEINISHNSDVENYAEVFPVSLNLTDLLPSTTYAISVRCLPALGGYWSDVRTLQITTSVALITIDGALITTAGTLLTTDVNQMNLFKDDSLLIGLTVGLSVFVLIVILFAVLYPLVVRTVFEKLCRKIKILPPAPVEVLEKSEPIRDQTVYETVVQFQDQITPSISAKFSDEIAPSPTVKIQDEIALSTSANFQDRTVPKDTPGFQEDEAALSCTSKRRSGSSKQPIMPNANNSGSGMASSGSAPSYCMTVLKSSSTTDLSKPASSPIDKYDTDLQSEEINKAILRESTATNQSELSDLINNSEPNNCRRDVTNWVESGADSRSGSKQTVKCIDLSIPNGKIIDTFAAIDKLKSCPDDGQEMKSDNFLPLDENSETSGSNEYSQAAPIEYITENY